MLGTRLPFFLGQSRVGTQEAPHPYAPLDCTLNLWGQGAGNLERQDLGILPYGSEYKSNMPLRWGTSPRVWEPFPQDFPGWLGAIPLIPS